ncbi:MAG: hypothetical protein JNK49_18345 [Planctomycetes bacterium]|nr:hypothetical protein [Planctomycetota bacterium]
MHKAAVYLSGVALAWFALQRMAELFVGYYSGADLQPPPGALLRSVAEIVVATGAAVAAIVTLPAN